MKKTFKKMLTSMFALSLALTFAGSDSLISLSAEGNPEESGGGRLI